MAKRCAKSPMTRSENMSRIRSKNTSIEVLLGKAMWNLGLNYRKHENSVFGKPDFVFKSKKIAVFCDSEFWHGKYLMEEKYIPKTNAEYWIAKLKRNIQRDIDVNAFLESEGWTVVRFWEEDIRKDPKQCALEVEALVKNI